MIGGPRYSRKPVANFFSRGPAHRLAPALGDPSWASFGGHRQARGVWTFKRVFLGCDTRALPPCTHGPLPPLRLRLVPPPPIAARTPRHARANGRGQPALSGGHQVEGVSRGGVACSAGPLRELEHGLAPVRPLGAGRRLAALVRPLPGPRSGLAAARLGGRPGDTSRIRRSPSGASEDQTGVVTVGPSGGSSRVHTRLPHPHGPP